jgi:hypothetical protein
VTSGLAAERGINLAITWLIPLIGRITAIMGWSGIVGQFAVERDEHNSSEDHSEHDFQPSRHTEAFCFFAMNESAFAPSWVDSLRRFDRTVMSEIRIARD